MEDDSTKRASVMMMPVVSSSTSSARTAVLPYTDRHQEALQLELSLLMATLQRNRSSQRRTQYYRRLKMAVQHLQRHNVANLYTEWHQVLDHDLPQLQQSLANEKEEAKKKRKRQEIFWEITGSGGGKSSSSSSSSNTITDNKELMASPSASACSNDAVSVRHRLSQMTMMIQDLCSRTTNTLANFSQQCLSRLEYAAEACWAEIVRGFFLPFLTVAVGCVARIHRLLLRLRHHVIAQLEQAIVDCCQLLLEIISWESNNNNSNNNNDDENDMKKIKQLLMEVVETMRTNVAAAINDATTPRASSSGNRRTRAQLTTATLQSLGIIASRSATLEKNITKGDDDSSVIAAAAAAAKTHNDKSQRIIALDDKRSIGGGGNAQNKQRHDETHSTDVGESVGAATMVGVVTSKEEAPIIRKSSITKLLFVDDAGVDQNATVLQKLKDKKKSTNSSDKKKSKKEKRQRKSTDNEGSSSRKKKKKKKGGDFFDDLFG